MGQHTKKLNHPARATSIFLWRVSNIRIPQSLGGYQYITFLIGKSCGSQTSTCTRVPWRACKRLLFPPHFRLSGWDWASWEHWSRQASTTNISIYLPLFPSPSYFAPCTVCSMVNLLRTCPILQYCALISFIPKFENFTQCLCLSSAARNCLLKSRLFCWVC